MTDGKKIAIWGTGSLAKKVVLLYCDINNIECFFDNDDKKNGTLFLGKPVYKYEDYISNGKNTEFDGKIIIASSYWRDIVYQLKAKGKKPYEDYILWGFIFGNYVTYEDVSDFALITGVKDLSAFKGEKQIITIYGNCQTDRIEKILAVYKEYVGDTIIISTPKVFQYESKKELIERWLSDSNFWTIVDIFIYQEVKVDNRFSSQLCTDEMKLKLRTDCIKVQILNLYFTGYFPQAYIKPVNEREAGVFDYGDKCIDELYKEGKYSVDDIIDIIKGENYIDAKVIDENINSSLAELEEREKKADVKILDYILANYKTKQLFYSYNHPCEELCVEYADRIVKYIGQLNDKIVTKSNMSNVDFCLVANTMKGRDILVYPCVRKHLGLVDYETHFYSNRYITDNAILSFEEYIRLYIKNVIIEA